MKHELIWLELLWKSTLSQAREREITVSSTGHEKGGSQSHWLPTQMVPSCHPWYCCQGSGLWKRIKFLVAYRCTTVDLGGNHGQMKTLSSIGYRSPGDKIIRHAIHLCRIHFQATWLTMARKRWEEPTTLTWQRYQEAAHHACNPLMWVGTVHLKPACKRCMMNGCSADWLRKLPMGIGSAHCRRIYSNG